MTVITRFAPSPTGYLHIGGGRTALFNWLFARHHQGKFLLRIEDTDKERSTQEAKQAIIDGLQWLGLSWDGDIVYQSEHQPRHADIAQELLAQGKAYYCYCTPEELDQMRKEAVASGKPIRSKWRDAAINETRPDTPPVIRIKAPLTGETTIHDLVQGDVTVKHEQLDDMVLLRSDGSPTYMLSVVVDDHDMDITHVIRGDDHLNNLFRQNMIYEAMGWKRPEFAHIPLIHGPDGHKLSKRHGAVGIETYRDMGYLPEALRNYLARLGWSHGDAEIFNDDQAIKWFNLDTVGKAPSRLDFDKLNFVNAHYIKERSDRDLAHLVQPRLEEAMGHPIDAKGLERLQEGMPGLKVRAHTLVELEEISLFYVHPLPLPLTDTAKAQLESPFVAKVKELGPILEYLSPWSEGHIESTLKQFCQDQGLKFGQIGPVLRAALTGSTSSPSLYEVMRVLGKEECLARLRYL